MSFENFVMASTTCVVECIEVPKYGTSFAISCPAPLLFCHVLKHVSSLHVGFARSYQVFMTVTELPKAKNKMNKLRLERAFVGARVFTTAKAREGAMAQTRPLDIGKGWHNQTRRRIIVNTSEDLIDLSRPKAKGKEGFMKKVENVLTLGSP